MNSLDDSSLAEVKAAIRSEPWLEAHFDIGEKYIRTKSRRISYKFSGMDKRTIMSVTKRSLVLSSSVLPLNSIKPACFKSS